VLFALFWLTRARWRPGMLMGTFALGYGMARFIVEFYREPDQQLEEFRPDPYVDGTMADGADDPAGPVPDRAVFGAAYAGGAVPVRSGADG
jgi:phosphatidylglycerol:prolipoprotein diacylglycerol transferase